MRISAKHPLARKFGPRKATANKYGAKRVKCDGYTFDSKREHARYIALLQLKAAKLIKGLKVHPRYPIYLSAPDGKTTLICDVVLDFEYEQIGLPSVFIIEDVKGRDNPMSKLKRKLFEAYYGRKVTIIK